MQTGTAGGLITGSCPFSAQVGSSGVYLSPDGGHWTQPTYGGGSSAAGSGCTFTIRTLPGYCAAGLVSNGDPAIAFGPQPDGQGGFTLANGARAYYANLAFPLGNLSVGALLAVSRSDDDGASWFAPVVASSTDNPIGEFNDKEAIWADKTPASPCFGSAYASWTLFPGSPSFSPELVDRIMFTRSTDGGTTWSKAQILTPSYNNNAVGGRQGSMIRSLPDGTVIVVWEDALSKTSTIVAAVSHNCGRTFSARIPISTLVDIPSPFPGTSFRSDSFPSIDTDGRGVAYVSWSDFSSGTAVVRLSSSGDGGQTWTAPVAVSNPRSGNAFFNATGVSPDGKHVVVSYLNLITTAASPGAGAASYGSVFGVSTDGGRTFSRQALSSTSGDPDGSSTNSLAAQFLGDYTSIVSTNTAAYPIWTDSRNAVPCAAVDSYRAAVAAGQSAPKPDPDLANQCPMGFGNTDIYAAVIAY